MLHIAKHLLIADNGEGDKQKSVNYMNTSILTMPRSFRDRWVSVSIVCNIDTLVTNSQLQEHITNLESYLVPLMMYLSTSKP
jgi:hypothetical protein